MSWWAALAGGRSVGAPRIVAMMEKMHKKHGVLPWEKLFVDAINLSENGFEVSPKLALAIKNKQNPALGRYKEAWEYFFPNDEPLKAKSIKTNKKLAKTFNKYKPLSAEAVHLITQSSKLAFADRTQYMADADWLTWWQ